MGLVLVERVLALQVQIDRARLRAQPRPDGLAAVLDARPLEAAGQPRPRQDELPRLLAGEEGLVRVAVKRVDVAALRAVRAIPAARGARRRALGEQHRLLRPPRVQRIHLIEVVIDAQHIDGVPDRRARRAAIHRGGHGARAVQPVHRLTHPPGDAKARVLRVQRLLVAHGPEDHARTVAVAPHEHLKLREALRRALEPARLGHHQEAQLVKRVHRRRRVRIVRAAVGVRAHLAHQLQPVALHAPGHRPAGQAVVLMAADALNLHAPPVEEEALLRVEADRAEAEAAAVALDDLAAHGDLRLHRVQVRRIDVPQLRGLHGAAKLQRLPLPRADAERPAHARRLAALRVARHADHLRRLILIAVVAQRHVHRQRPRAALARLGMDEHAVSVHRHALRALQPDRAHDARALVPPALVLADVDVHGDDVVPAAVRHVGDVHLEGRVGAAVGQHEAAVDVDLAVDGHALEEQADAPPGVACGKREVAAVPGVLIAEEAQRGVVLLPRRLRDHIVVRQRHARKGRMADQPRRCVEVLRVREGEGRRAAASALRLGLHVDRGFLHRRLHGDLPLVKEPVPAKRLDLLHHRPSRQNSSCQRTVISSPSKRTGRML